MIEIYVSNNNSFPILLCTFNINIDFFYFQNTIPYWKAQDEMYMDNLPYFLVPILIYVHVQ